MIPSNVNCASALMPCHTMPCHAAMPRHAMSCATSLQYGGIVSRIGHIWVFIWQRPSILVMGAFDHNTKKYLRIMFFLIVPCSHLVWEYHYSAHLAPSTRYAHGQHPKFGNILWHVRICLGILLYIVNVYFVISRKIVRPLLNIKNT